MVSQITLAVTFFQKVSEGDTQVNEYSQEKSLRSENAWQLQRTDRAASVARVQ